MDRFLEDVEDKSQERKEIFGAYCGLQCPENKTRNQEFKQMLNSTEFSELRDVCDENIRRFSKVGARLPYLPALRNRVLDWHVVVFLWEILGPYVEERRSASGPSFAETFLKYALASVNRLLKQSRSEWVIVDPDLSRKANVTLNRDRLVEMKKELHDSLTRQRRRQG